MDVCRPGLCALAGEMPLDKHANIHVYQCLVSKLQERCGYCSRHDVSLNTSRQHKCVVYSHAFIRSPVRRAGQLPRRARALGWRVHGTAFVSNNAKSVFHRIKHRQPRPAQNRNTFCARHDKPGPSALRNISTHTYSTAARAHNNQPVSRRSIFRHHKSAHIKITLIVKEVL